MIISIGFLGVLSVLSSVDSDSNYLQGCSDSIACGFGTAHYVGSRLGATIPFLPLPGPFDFFSLAPTDINSLLESPSPPPCLLPTPFTIPILLQDTQLSRCVVSLLATGTFSRFIRGGARWQPHHRSGAESRTELDRTDGLRAVTLRCKSLSRPL